jgi:hypothetical protein
VLNHINNIFLEIIFIKFLEQNVPSICDRNLIIGDYLFYLETQDKEFFLPIVIERKRLDGIIITNNNNIAS